MIRAFYILKDVEGSLKFFSKENIIFVGIGEDEIFNLFEEVRNYYYKFVANAQIKQQFESTNYIASKNFLYKDDLPYCYVNDLFLKLPGHKKIKLENYSSLADIHPNDQQKYNEDVKVLECGNLLSFNGNFIQKLCNSARRIRNY